MATRSSRDAPDLFPRSGLEAWLPAGVLWECVAVHLPPAAETTPLERAQVQAAVVKRQREFLTGRVTARRLLMRLGVPATELPVGPGRAPAWPPEVVGSIAHSHAWCLVGVAPRRSLAGLGLDVEAACGLAPDLWPRICTEPEQEWLADRPEADRGLWALRLFSAKEAVYKCQFPVTGRFLGFQDLQVLPAAGGQFRARARAGSSDLAAVIAAGRGTWREAEDSVFSAFSFEPVG